MWRVVLGRALAVGQAALSATHYQDAASRGVINRMRPLVGRSVIDFELLFEQLIAARKPLSFDGLASGPEFRALATWAGGIQTVGAYEFSLAIRRLPRARRS